MTNVRRSLLAALGLILAGSTTALAQSGPLLVYTPHGNELTDPLLAAFAARYPQIQVSLVKGGTGEVLQRLQAEAANPAADVMWGGPTQTFDGAPDLFEEYVSPTSADFIVQDPNRRWHALNVLVQPIIYNTTRLGETYSSNRPARSWTCSTRSGRRWAGSRSPTRPSRAPASTSPEPWPPATAGRR
jgi:ABC-type thiamine transport system substrate-binding protein